MNLSSSTGWKTKKKYLYYYDSGAYVINGCTKKHPKIRPDEVEKQVYEAMKQRVNTLVIAKKEAKNLNPETESIKADIIRIDNEIRGMLDKLSKADTILFDYINQRVKELHSKKLELEQKLNTQTRKHKTIDTKPIEEPMSRWDNLTMQEKHEFALSMIDVVYVSDETGIDIHFSI